MARVKKKKSAKSSPAKKATAAPKNVDKYIAAAPLPARRMLTKLRETIHSVVPAEATETISYQIPESRVKRVLVWFAAFANP